MYEPKPRRNGHQVVRRSDVETLELLRNPVVQELTRQYVETALSIVYSQMVSTLRSQPIKGFKMVESELNLGIYKRKMLKMKLY